MAYFCRYLCQLFICFSLLPSIYSHASLNIFAPLLYIYLRLTYYILDLILVGHSFSIHALLVLFYRLLDAFLLVIASTYQLFVLSLILSRINFLVNLFAIFQKFNRIINFLYSRQGVYIFFFKSFYTVFDYGKI